MVATGSGLDFEALQQRIHPAASRVAMLAERTPAAFVAFDLLVADGADLSSRGFAERREGWRSCWPAALRRCISRR